MDSGRTGGGGMVVLYIERGVMVEGGRWGDADTIVALGIVVDVVLDDGGVATVSLFVGLFVLFIEKWA